MELKPDIVEIDEEEFYRIAGVIAKGSKKGKFAAKSPILLLPSEQKSSHRKKYYEALLKRIKNQKLKTEYLFSLPYLKSELNRLNKTEVEKIMNWWKLLLTYKNLDLRFTDSAFDSCIIGDFRVLRKMAQKRYAIEVNSKNSKEIERDFSIIFKKSTKP